MCSVLFEAVEVKLVKVEVADDVVKKRDALVAAQQCVRCEESVAGRQVRKGCCPACYQMALRDLKDRKTTKRQLVQDGHWCDAKRGRPLSNKLRRGL